MVVVYKLVRPFLAFGSGSAVAIVRLPGCTYYSYVSDTHMYTQYTHEHTLALFYTQAEYQNQEWRGKNLQNYMELAKKKLFFGLAQKKSECERSGILCCGGVQLERTRSAYLIFSLLCTTTTTRIIIVIVTKRTM